MSDSALLLHDLGLCLAFAVGIVLGWLLGRQSASSISVQPYVVLRQCCGEEDDGSEAWKNS